MKLQVKCGCVWKWVWCIPSCSKGILYTTSYDEALSNHIDDMEVLLSWARELRPKRVFRIADKNGK